MTIDRSEAEHVKHNVVHGKKSLFNQPLERYDYDY